jgi:hypothetical protein
MAPRIGEPNSFPQIPNDPLQKDNEVTPDELQKLHNMENETFRAPDIRQPLPGELEKAKASKTGERNLEGKLQQALLEGALQARLGTAAAKTPTFGPDEGPGAVKMPTFGPSEGPGAIKMPQPKVEQPESNFEPSSISIPTFGQADGPGAVKMPQFGPGKEPGPVKMPQPKMEKPFNPGPVKMPTFEPSGDGPGPVKMPTFGPADGPGAVKMPDLGPSKEPDSTKLPSRNQLDDLTKPRNVQEDIIRKLIQNKE